MASLRAEIINIGQQLHQLGLVAGRAGNLSARLDSNHILISTSGSSLGRLRPRDIVKVNLKSKPRSGRKCPSSEFPLHSLVYRSLPVKKIIHCHPPLTNAYFLIYSRLKALTPEAKVYLGDIPVVKQDTPTVTKPREVIQALANNRLVVLKNHGVVSIGDNFTDALLLIETLENSIKIAALARLFKKGILDPLDKRLKKALLDS